MVGLTKIHHDMVRAEGGVDESSVKVLNGTLHVTAADEPDVSEVQTGFYDAHQGILALTMFNGTRIQVSGFPTALAAPVGHTGPDGREGRDGQDGKDGRDGECGDEGCEGPPGLMGAMGPTGPDGRTGQQGMPGIKGCPGPAGPVGPPGPTGPIGPVGPTGPIGEQGPAGVPGAAGPTGTVNIKVSTTDPGAIGAGWLWVNPNATGGSTETGSGAVVTDPPLGTVPWP